MRWRNLLLPLLSALLVRGQQYVVPPGSPGYYHGNSTQRIQFDKQSLWIDGKRIFLLGGEFHPWRLPVPELWSDILQKMKAAGMNSVSIYVNWGLTEGKRGSLDWSEWRSIEKFYQVAKEIGLYVIARPGPYINAETTGGGFPGWLSNEPAQARTNQTGYTDAWQLYIQQFSQITNKYQWPAGPVIAVQAENEFYSDGSVAINPTASEYMALLTTKFRDSGIDRIPLIVNDVYPSGHFAPGTGLGEVDIYAFDSYPNGFNCSAPETWNEVADFYRSGNEAVNPNGLIWIPEFQGGGLDGWGGVGYDGCYALLGPQFVDVFYKHNVAVGSKAMSFYMFYGGTNFGNSAYPGVYTSYDYGGAIHESRSISDKYNQVKLQGLFYQSSPSLPNVTFVSEVNTTSEVTTTLLSDGKTAYYVVRQRTNTKTTSTNFQFTLNTTAGAVTKPVVLDGRESKILVSDYPFGSSIIQYTTAEILTHVTTEGKDYLVLYVPSGQSFETLIHSPTVSQPATTSKVVHVTTGKNSTVVLSGTLDSGNTHVITWGKTVVLVTDKKTAQDSFWNPHLDSQTFDVSPAKASVIVTGPLLVRTVQVTGSTISLVGDTSLDARSLILQVYGAPSSVRDISWNGLKLKTTASIGVGLSATATSPATNVNLPVLSKLKWKTLDSLPEVAINFDDSKWVIADKKSANTTRPIKPIAGDVLLYADEYGYHSGTFVYRGYFNGTAGGASLNIQTGAAPGYSAFLNGKFIASGVFITGDNMNVTLTFPTDVVVEGKNVLTVVTDSSGLDGDWDSNDSHKNPRGIKGYELLNSTAIFDTWKLAGTLGGEDYPDKVRGPYNEGGLYVERLGGTLPEFSYTKWANGSPYEGTSKPGVQAYHTTFSLDIPQGLDLTLGFKLAAIDKTNNQGHRVQIFVNGWNYARYISNFGPQTAFPVPEGIINHQGTNDVVVVVWSLDGAGAKLETLDLVQLYGVRSGKKAVSGPVASPGFSALRG